MGNNYKSGAGRPAKTFIKRMVRKPVTIRVEVERGQEELLAESVNMSPSGVCFNVGELLDEAERCNILLYIPENKEIEIIKVQARIVWQREQDDGRFRTGAAFEVFAPGDERRIRAWLLSLPKEGWPPNSA